VRTAFRTDGTTIGEPTELEIQDYEKKKNEKRDLAVVIALLGLAAVFGIVILIFLYQAMCGKHVENEFEKRKEVFKKEDQKIRQTIKHRKTTIALREKKLEEANRSKASYVAVEQNDKNDNEA